MDRVIELKFAKVVYTDYGCRTIFKADNSHVDATPHDTHHYHVIAHRLGYAGDIMAYCREHEVCHEIIAEEMMGGTSKVLWALAHGRHAEKWMVTYEEIAAQTLQRWLRSHERPIVSGVDWDALKTHSLKLLDSA